MRKIDKEELERAARIYKSNKEASAALGIACGSFSRACRIHGVETPYSRARRKRREAQEKTRVSSAGAASELPRGVK